MSGETGRLPRGRHTLSRTEVATQQRARILAALTDVLAERGYVDTPVAAIIERAGVSRETFYQLFASKQDCFIAALEDTIDHLTTKLLGSLPEYGRGLHRFDRVLESYLETLTAWPATARLFLIETYAAGREAMRRRLDLQDRFVDHVAHLFDAESSVDRFACQALVGALISKVTSHFVEGTVADLATLRAPFVELAGRMLTSGTGPASESDD